MSLDNAFTEAELHAWGDRLQRRLDEGDGPVDVGYVCEPKIDGLAISIRYEGGRFVQAATRGDGRTGEDVTANIATLDEVPADLGRKAPPVLEIRGEVYMSMPAFAALNAASGGEGPAPLREPPQRGRRCAAPEGLVDHGQPRAVAVDATSSARSRAVPPSPPTTRRSTSSATLVSR